MSAQLTKSGAFKPIVYHHGRRFYSLLVMKQDDPNRICLFGSNDYQYSDFVIGYDDPSFIPTPTKSKSSIFTSFRSYIDYFHFFNSLSPDQRTCYEIIRNGPQKPHFDADIELKESDPNLGKYTIQELGTLMKLSLTSAIKDVMQQFNVNYKQDTHLIWHDSSTPTKQSFHVVINGFFHSDNTEAKAFFQLVKAKLHPTISHYLDHAVYGSNQQFRLLNNHKINKSNTKTIDTSITKWRPTDGRPGDPVYELRFLEASLVSFTSDSVSLPSFSAKTSRGPSDNTNYTAFERQLYDIFETSAVSASGTIRDFNGKYANINTSHNFRCPICDKIHANENPRLIISKGSVYWDCSLHW